MPRDEAKVHFFGQDGLSAFRADDVLHRFEVRIFLGHALRMTKTVHGCQWGCEYSDQQEQQKPQKAR